MDAGLKLDVSKLAGFRLLPEKLPQAVLTATPDPVRTGLKCGVKAPPPAPAPAPAPPPGD